MDFSKFDLVEKANEGAWMTITDPFGEETDARVKLVGTDSKLYKRRLHQIGDKNRKVKKGLKAAELETEMLQTYAVCCVDFEKCFLGKKEVKADNQEDVIAFFESYPPVLDQIAEFLGDRTNFLSS